MWLLLLPTHQPRAWGCHSDTELMFSVRWYVRPCTQWTLITVVGGVTALWSPGQLGAALAVLADAPQVGVPSPKHLPVVLSQEQMVRRSFCSVTS